MKVTKKEILEAIRESAGEEGIALYEALKGKTKVSEFKLASEIKEEVNRTRNLLYQLYHANLVSFTRKKDKKKGWYIYYWTFHPNKVKHYCTQMKKKKLENLKERLKRENSEHFFSCENNCMRLNFEKAVEFDFKCPECGELIHQEDNDAKKKDIKKQIDKLEKELK